MEHPEDRKIRLEAIADAEKRIDKFMIDNINNIRAIFLIYEDAKAETMLKELRERLWGQS